MNQDWNDPKSQLQVLSVLRDTMIVSMTWGHSSLGS